MAEPKLHQDPEAAAQMAVNAVLKYLKECGLRTQDEKQAWISKVFWKISARINRPSNSK